MNALTSTGEQEMATRFEQYLDMRVTVEYQKSSMDSPVTYRGRLRASSVGKTTGRWFLKVEHDEPVEGSNGKTRKGTSFIPEKILQFTVDTPDLGPVHIYW